MMGKNKSKRKPVTPFQRMESIMAKLDFELEKQAQTNKKNQRVEMLNKQ